MSTVVVTVGANTYGVRVDTDGTVKATDPHGFLFPIGRVAPRGGRTVAHPDREGVHEDAPGLWCEHQTRIGAVRYLVGLALATGHRIAER